MKNQPDAKRAILALLGKPAMAAMAILGGVLLVPPIIRAVRK